MNFRGRKFRHYALMAVSAACNQKCVFCFEADSRYKIPPHASLIKMIDEIADRGFERIVFIGGEAALTRNIDRLIEHIRKRGMAAHITTNGLALSDPARLDALIRAGLQHIEFSFHSHREQDAALLSGRPDTHKLQCRALENIRAATNSGAAFTVNVNTVITTINASYLTEMVCFLETYECLSLYALKVPTLEGRLKDNEHLLPRYREITPAVRDVFQILSCRENRLILDNFPLCVLDPELVPCTVAFKDMDIILEGFNYGERVENERFDMFRAEKSSERCRFCALSAICGGFSSRYFSTFSDDEVVPIRSLWNLPKYTASAAAECLSLRALKDIRDVEFLTQAGMMEQAMHDISEAKAEGFRNIRFNVCTIENPGHHLISAMDSALQQGLQPTLLCRAFPFSDPDFTQHYSRFQNSVKTELVFVPDNSRRRYVAEDSLFKQDCMGVMRLVRNGMSPTLIIPIMVDDQNALVYALRLAAELGADNIVFLYDVRLLGGIAGQKEFLVAQTGDSVAGQVGKALSYAEKHYPSMNIKLQGFPLNMFPSLHYLYKAPYHEIS